MILLRRAHGTDILFLTATIEIWPEDARGQATTLTQTSSHPLAPPQRLCFALKLWDIKHVFRLERRLAATLGINPRPAAAPIAAATAEWIATQLRAQPITPRDIWELPPAPTAGQTTPPMVPTGLLDIRKAQTFCFAMGMQSIPSAH
jgi:hypothetical protein